MRGLAVILTLGAAIPLFACSPEARRVRDGGPGADPGNKVLVVRDGPDPHAADTTLWPGRAPTPVDLLARGIVPPPAYPTAEQAPTRDTMPITPKTSPSVPQQRTFDSGRTANPRRQTDR